MRFALALLFALIALPAAAELDSAPKVHAQLIAETGEIAPGGTVTVALEEIIRPGWHTYWTNPGEAGLPTEIKWTLPPGWHASAIEWPYPKRLPVGPLMQYGYENKVWLLTKITASKDAKPGVVTLNAAADWLVCKEVCIPEDTKLSLPLTVTASPTPPYATVEEQFAAARAKLPTPSPWPVTFHLGETLNVLVKSLGLATAALKDVQFFPLAGNTITDMAPQTFAGVRDGLVLQLKPAKAPKIGNALNGVLALTSTDGSVQALSIHAQPGPVPQIAAAETPASMSLPLAILFAFLGGLILNLMPCVLPVLAMKALAIAQQAHGDRGIALRDSLGYGVGAILSFIAFGVAIAFLRAGGDAIGWGFQLQNPVVVTIFALLFFAVGLNLSGVFEIGGIGAGESLTRKGGLTGSFFTGVLAVAVAAPCTAPFMAAALGFAFTQSTAISLEIFAALGVGFALPFVLLGVTPALARWLPKPGAWMVTLRQLLAFPMYGAAAWLIWVLSQQTGATALAYALGAFLLLAFAAWAWSASRMAGTRWRVAGTLFALAALAGTGAVVYAISLASIPPAAAAAAGGMDASEMA